MTIDEISKQLRISKRTLYQRLKEQNIAPASLRDEQRQLTSEGMSIIAALFPDKTYSGTSGNVLKTNENACETANKTKDAGENDVETENENVLLHSENAALKRETELLREMLDDMRRQRDKYQAEVSQLLAALEAAQEMQQRLLPEGRSSWWARFFSRK